jgi:hypothetical protein
VDNAGPDAVSALPRPPAPLLGNVTATRAGMARERIVQVCSMRCETRQPTAIRIRMLHPGNTYVS